MLRFALRQADHEHGTRLFANFTAEEQAAIRAQGKIPETARWQGRASLDDLRPSQRSSPSPPIRTPSTITSANSSPTSERLPCRALNEGREQTHLLLFPLPFHLFPDFGRGVLSSLVGCLSQRISDRLLPTHGTALRPGHEEGFFSERRSCLRDLAVVLLTLTQPSTRSATGRSWEMTWTVTPSDGSRPYRVNLVMDRRTDLPVKVLDMEKVGQYAVTST